MSDFYLKFLSRAAGRMRGSAIRQMGTLSAGVADLVSFAPGYPADDAFAWDAFRAIADDVLGRADTHTLQYGPTPGYRPLREVIAGVMADRGVASPVNRIIVTTGSQQGLDLVARVLLDPGDVVLLELPSYTGAIMAFRNAGASMVGVRQQGAGIDLEDLHRVASELRREGRRVKLLYVVPNFQNPTGLLAPVDERRALLEWARHEDLLIVEDDPYGDLYFSDCSAPADIRPIAADDDDVDGRVVYLSSFSKTLAPGFRVAWIGAAPPLAAKFEIAKQATDLCSGSLDQALICEACRRGVLDAQKPRLRALYEARRDAMVSALREAPGAALTWPTPRGGFFLWARLPDGLSSEALLPAARARGVIFVAGTAFYVDGAGQEYVRLSFSAPPADRIALGIQRLADAIADARASSAHLAIGAR